MKLIPRADAERTMKVQEVILRAMAKSITWWQAAEILGFSVRQMRRWRRPLRAIRLRRAVGPAARPTQSPARAAGTGRAGAAVVPGEVSRF